MALWQSDATQWNRANSRGAFDRYVAPSGFSFTIETTAASESYSNSSYFEVGSPSVTIDWGDGSSEEVFTSGIPSHVYAAAGQYQITYKSMVDFNPWFRNDTNIISVDSAIPEMNPGGFILYVENMFDSCSNLASIVFDLFSNNSDIESFNATFSYCTSLAAIPSGLFDNNVDATEMTGVFDGCTALTSIPSGLFDSCINVTDFSFGFQDCTELIAIPSGLFSNNASVTTYRKCFSGDTSLTGNAPELWNLVPEPIGLFCFEDCTGLSNYAAIPVDWK